MPSHEDGPGPVGTGTEAGGQTGQDDHRHRTARAQPEPVTVADIFRQHAVLDLAAIGVRPAGPLSWTPADPPPREDAITIARRRELARCRVAELERRWREQRIAAAWWTEVAA
jgi:hypothetical protein